MNNTNCCEEMEYFSSLHCDEHKSVYDCPDVLIGIFNNGEKGIIIHDGGTSKITINYCPWCGKKISSST